MLAKPPVRLFVVGSIMWLLLGGFFWILGAGAFAFDPLFLAALAIMMVAYVSRPKRDNPAIPLRLGFSAGALHIVWFYGLERRVPWPSIRSLVLETGPTLTGKLIAETEDGLVEAPYVNWDVAILVVWARRLASRGALAPSDFLEGPPAPALVTATPVGATPVVGAAPPAWVLEDRLYIRAEKGFTVLAREDIDLADFRTASTVVLQVAGRGRKATVVSPDEGIAQFREWYGAGAPPQLPVAREAPRPAIPVEPPA